MHSTTMRSQAEKPFLHQAADALNFGGQQSRRHQTHAEPCPASDGRQSKHTHKLIALQEFMNLPLRCSYQPEVHDAAAQDEGASEAGAALPRLLVSSTHAPAAQLAVAQAAVTTHRDQFQGQLSCKDQESTAARVTGW